MEIIIISFILTMLTAIYLSKNEAITKPYKKRNSNNINSNKNNLYNTIYKKNTLKGKIQMSPTDIAIFFNISARELNIIFAELKWAKKEERWWIATELGKEKGATEHYDYKRKIKFLKWDSNVKTNLELIERINKFKKNKQPKNEEIKSKNNQKMTNKEKKEKGDKYEIFISQYYRTQGYTIAEHGQDNGVKDNGIDIIAKKDKEILFIQCKNWSASGTNKVRDKEIKVTRQDIQDYIKKNPLYKMGNYNLKLIYIMSENILHGSAYHYIQENSDIIEYRIIPMIV